MKEIIELITQILLLLTAVVGMVIGLIEYFKRKSNPIPNKTSQSPPNSSILAIFKPFLSIAGTLLSILAFPLFIFLFIFIMNAASSLGDGNKKQNIITNQYYMSSTVFSNMTINEKKLFDSIYICDNINSSYNKDKALEDIFYVALNNKFYYVSIEAVQHINSTFKHDALLALMISNSISNNIHATSLALNNINLSYLKDNLSLYTVSLLINTISNKSLFQ